MPVCEAIKQSEKTMLVWEDVPGSAVGVDIGTLSWADGEFHYFLYGLPFHRLVELMPFRDQLYRSFVTAFEQDWVYQGHGIPGIILIDKESRWMEQSLRSFVDPSGSRSITHLHTILNAMGWQREDAWL